MNLVGGIGTPGGGTPATPTPPTTPRGTSLALGGFGSLSVAGGGFGSGTAIPLLVEHPWSGAGFDIDLVQHLADRHQILLQPGHLDRRTGSPGYPIQYPALVYNLITEDRARWLSGRPDGLVTAVYQFDAYAPRRVDALALAERLRRLLDGFAGDVGDTWVQSAALQNRTSSYEDAVDSSDRGTHRVLSEYRFVYRESFGPIGVPLS